MKRNRGLTLSGILVAVLVLGIGLLGVAGLQARALQMNTGSYQRTQAMMLAQSMVDRMRANAKDTVSQNGYYDMGGSASASTTAACTTTAGCDEQQIASKDLAVWTGAVTDRLPGGTGVVCIDSTPDDGLPGAVACDGAGDLYAIKI